MNSSHLDPFASAREKVAWAREWINHLCEVLEAHRSEIERNSTPQISGIGSLIITNADPPESLPHLVSAIIQPLRAALDHATSQMKGVFDGKPNFRVTFPLDKNIADRDRSRSRLFVGKLKAVDQRLTDYIWGCPHHANCLLGLNALANADKHRRLTFIVTATPAHHQGWIGNNYVDFTAQDCEIDMLDMSGGGINVQTSVRINLVFGKGEAFAGQSAPDQLKAIADTVAITLEEMSRGWALSQG